MKRTNDISSGFVDAVPAATGGDEAVVTEEMRTASAWYVLHKVGRGGRWFVRKGLNEETHGRAVFERLLRREYELLADLDHQNIVRAYRWLDARGDVGSAFEMQYVDGRTLGEFLDEKPSRERKVKVARQLIDVVAYIHGKQVTHQNIKPSNILVAWNGDRVKLIDFGLAHDDAAQLKLPAGTEDYIAPEVLDGSTADSLSDLYSLGRVLLDMDISPRVNRLVRKCLLTDRERRILDAATLRQAFLKALQPNYKFILATALVSACCIALCIFLFLPHKMPSPSAKDTMANPSQQTKGRSIGTWSWRGTIGPYEVIFNYQTNSNGVAVFTYHYTSNRVNQWRDIPLIYVGRSGGLETWREYINGNNTGTFTVRITKQEISGSFVNAKGEKYVVSAQGTGGKWSDLAEWPFE